MYFCDIVFWGEVMPIKIKIVKSRPARVNVRVRKPAWQQFLVY